MPENRSAEFWRGAMEQLGVRRSYPEIDALLAEAEAREAPEVIPGTREALAGLTIRPQAPTAADLAVADELDRLAEHVQTLPPDDYRDDIKRICHNRAKDLRRGVKRAPTSEQVIAAAERALESVSFECDGKADCDDGLDGVANVPNLAMRCEMAVGPALALITKWKEAR